MHGGAGGLNNYLKIFSARRDSVNNGHVIADLVSNCRLDRG